MKLYLAHPFSSRKEIREWELKIEKKIQENIPGTFFNANSFEIVFDNLLSNAIRYTPAGGEIKLDKKTASDEEVQYVPCSDEKEILKLTAGIESKSTHPIALAVVQHAGDVISNVDIQNIEEISGHGLKGTIDGKEVLAGNLKLLKKFKIEYDKKIETIVPAKVAFNETIPNTVNLHEYLKDRVFAKGIKLKNFCRTLNKILPFTNSKTNVKGKLYIKVTPISTY